MNVTELETITPGGDWSQVDWSVLDAMCGRLAAAEKLVEALARISKATYVDPWNDEGQSYEATIAAAALAEWKATK